MKNLIIPLSCVILIGCHSIPKQFLVGDDFCRYEDPIFSVSEKELVLDKPLLQRIRDTEGEMTIIDDKDFKNEFSKSLSFITNKQTNKQLKVNKWIYYTEEGKIENVLFTYNNIYEIKKQTHYDGEGNITKVIDYEKGYNICWAEAIEIVKRIAKRDIKKYGITDFYAVHNDLNEFPEVSPVWYIGLLKGNERYHGERAKNGQIRFRIDGVTGKLLKRYRIKSAY